jgi:hypothetical protein
MRQTEQINTSPGVFFLDAANGWITYAQPLGERRRQDLERRVLNVSGLSCIRQRPPLVCYPAGEVFENP